MGGYLFAITYGVSFLIPLLMKDFGKNEAFAGAIISSAVVATFLFVTISGHIADRLGTMNTVIMAGAMLAFTSFSFGFTTDATAYLMLVGAVFGVGWGVFYTLAPILLSSLIEPAQRIRFFAILSGSLLSGIGTGPLIGRVLQAQGLPIQQAFVIACVATVFGCLICGYLKIKLKYDNTSPHKVS